MHYTRGERAYTGALELLAGVRFHHWYGCVELVSYSVLGHDELDREKREFLGQII